MSADFGFVEAEGMCDVQILNGLIDAAVPVRKLVGSPEHGDELEIGVDGQWTPGIIPTSKPSVNGRHLTSKERRDGPLDLASLKVLIDVNGVAVGPWKPRFTGVRNGAGFTLMYAFMNIRNGESGKENEEEQQCSHSIRHRDQL